MQTSSALQNWLIEFNNQQKMESPNMFSLLLQVISRTLHVIPLIIFREQTLEIPFSKKKRDDRNQNDVNKWN